MTRSNILRHATVRRHALAVALACVCTSFLAPSAIAQAGAWGRQTSGTTVWLRSLSCPTATTCFAGGDSGTILATTNAGFTWTFQNTGAGAWFDGVSCTTAATCVAVGGSGTVRATTNGGVTWTAQNPGTTNTLKQVSCPTAATCVAVGLSGTIRATTNGGASWTAQVAGTANNLEGISCPTATTCVAVGNSGTILATTNGGATWTTQNSGTTNWLGAVSCPTAVSCVAVGANGTILATNNGGSSWATQNSGTTVALAGVSCPTTIDCWTVGSSGVITATANGGAAWTVQNSGASTLLYEVSCPTTSDCWAVGGSGTILATNGIYDTTPPETTITSGPSDGSVWTKKTVTFVYASSESDSTFQCAMDSAILAACPSSSMTYDELGLGGHTFQVRAIDPSGNADPTPATRTFTYAALDALAPDATVAALEFTVGGTLPVFPCPDGCQATFGGAGSAVGTAEVQLGDITYDASFVTSSGAVDGSAIYTEPALPFCPGVGSAVGTARLSGSATGLVHRSTTPSVAGNVTGVAVDLGYSYQRVGSSVVIAVTTATVTVSFDFPDSGVGSFTTDLTNGGAGAGVGAFVVSPQTAVQRCDASGSLPFELAGTLALGGG